MPRVQHVNVPVRNPTVLRDVLDADAWDALQSAVTRTTAAIGDRTIWNVNSTARGGGVAEMIRPMVGYARGLGIDARWVVISGDPDFFAVTKRIHNNLHTSAGDGGPLGDAERDVFDATTHANAEEFASFVRPGDIVIAHDPQTAGLVPPLRRLGARVVWRSHIGFAGEDPLVDRAWAFLRPFVELADAHVFTRRAYVPPWLSASTVHVIQPSIDPATSKNQPMDDTTAHAILTAVGVVACREGPTTFTRDDGSPGRVDRAADLVRHGPPPNAANPLVVQVSRWDRLKDMTGVLEGFAHVFDGVGDVHLALVGPSVFGVTDDPEGAGSFEEVQDAWRALPHAARARVQLVCLPMHDSEENGAIVNALQRHASVVVQKSLMEGFGLTVTEAMWKSRPVVASAVGGITDQIDNGRTGVLLEDPHDDEACGRAIADLLADPARAAAIGRAAHDEVRRRFLTDRHLRSYGELLVSLL
jgi:trehalose synthase